MRIGSLFALGAALACAMVLPSLASAQTVANDGVTVKIGSRSMRCGQTPVYMDRDMPTEGMSVPGEGLYLNPFLLQRQPMAVRQFIFKHECAHEVTGPDELGADCMAAKAGAREGWLKESDIAAVCRSFAGPKTATHPAGSTRCANIRRCFAGTQDAIAQRGKPTRTSSWSAGDSDESDSADGASTDGDTAPDTANE